jgi:hypothetical protein
MSNTTTSPTPVLITVKETAAILGITTRHIDALPKEGSARSVCD